MCKVIGNPEYADPLSQNSLSGEYISFRSICSRKTQTLVPVVSTSLHLEFEATKRKEIMVEASPVGSFKTHDHNAELIRG